MKRILSTLSVLFALAIALFGASTTFAAADSVTVNSVEFILMGDANGNGIANIGGEIVRISANITNTDDTDGCGLTVPTTATADLLNLGYGPAEDLTANCVHNTNPGDPLDKTTYTYWSFFLIAEGLWDVDTDTAYVTVTADDFDDDPEPGDSNALAFAIDNISPVIDSVGTLSITDDKGIDPPDFGATVPVGYGVAGINDAVTLSGASVTSPDGDTITIDLTNLTNQADLAQDVESFPVDSGVAVPEDNPAATYTITFTDNAGNTITAPSSPISVDNIMPIITNGGALTISTDNNSDGIAGINDKITVAGILCGVHADVVAKTVMLSALTGQDYLLDGVQSGPVVSGFGSLDLVTDFGVYALDDAGNMHTDNTTNTISVDNILPEFADTDPVLAITQDGHTTTHPTNFWYYYDGAVDAIRVRLYLDAGTVDGAKARMCVKSLENDVPGDTCTPSDFTNPLYYNEVGGVGTFNFTYNYAAHEPLQQEGYTLNFQIEDDAGNLWNTTDTDEVFTAVFYVNPKDDPLLDNAGTTDFSLINTLGWPNNDFTNLAQLVFNAVDPVGPTDLGRMTITGPIDLTDAATVTALQNFAANVTVSGGEMRVDSTALAALNMPATLRMIQPAAVQPGLVVKDNLGNILGYVPNDAVLGDSFVFGGDTISDFLWTAVDHSLTFNTTGFSEFDADNTAPTALIAPASGATGVANSANIVVTFSEPMDTTSLTYTIAPNPGNLNVAWSGGNTVATISHGIFVEAGGSYTFTITAAKDPVGNNLTGANASTFTIAGEAGGGTTGGGGNVGGRREGSNLNKVPNPNAQTSAAEDAETTEAVTHQSSYTGTGSTEFTDISGHWGETYIKQLAEAGFLVTPANKKFQPNEFITRAGAAKMIAMWMNDNIDDCTQDPYTDVSCTSETGKYVNYLKEQEVMPGYMDGTFQPNGPVTREYSLKILLHAKILMATSILDILSPFSDVKLGDWFYDTVMIGYKLDIVDGYTDGTFRPQREATRAEFAKMFVKTLL